MTSTSSGIDNISKPMVMPAETSPGIKTSEFYISLGTAIVGLAAAVGLIGPEETAGYENIVTKIAGLAAMVFTAVNYTIQRRRVKK